MSVIGNLVVNLSTNVAPFQQSMRTATGALGRFQSAAGGMAGKVGGFFRGIGSSLMGMTGIGALLTAGGLISAMKRSVELAGIQAKAEKKLAAVLRATGQAAGIAAKDMYKFAAARQQVTNFSDEATIDAMAQLATFKGLKGDEFLRATVAAQDMAAVLPGGMEMLSSIAIQLGKALNDPILGYTKLRKIGVTFTEQQVAQIKAMQQAGDVMGAQRVILDELEGEYGGVAEALASPATQFSNALGDMQEAIGRQLLPFLKLLNAEMKTWAEGATVAIDANGAFATFIYGLADAAMVLVKAFKYVQLGITGVMYTASLAADRMGVGIAGLSDDYMRQGQQLSNDIAAMDKKSWGQGLRDAVSALAKKFQDLQDKAKGAMGAMNEGALEAADSLETMIDNMKDDIRFMGLNDRQRQIMEMLRKGGIAVLPQADEALQLAAALDRVDAHKRLMEQGQQMSEKFRTPLDEYKKQIEDIRGLLSIGAITGDVAGRARSKALQDFMDSGEKKSTEAAAMLGAVERGSGESIRAVYQAIADSQKQREDAQVRKAQLDVARNTEELVRLQQQGTKAGEVELPPA